MTTSNFISKLNNMGFMQTQDGDNGSMWFETYTNGMSIFVGIMQPASIDSPISLNYWHDEDVEETEKDYKDCASACRKINQIINSL